MKAFLAIDVQKALISGAYNEVEVLSAISLTIKKIRNAGGLIVFTQHCHSSFKPMMKGQPGWQLHDSLDVRPNDIIVEKTASDSFYQSSLDQTLQDHKVDHVVVSGLQTEFCVDATCRSALSHGYSVTLVSDAHTTGDGVFKAKDVISHHNYALSYLAHPSLSIEITSSAEI